MPKVAFVVKMTAREGKRDELVAGLGELAALAEREPGTEVYAVHVSAGEPAVVWTYELYADEAALAAHRDSEAVRAVARRMRDCVAGPPEILRAEPVRGKGLGT